MKKLLIWAVMCLSLTAQAQVGELFGGTINVFAVDDNTGPVFAFRAFFNEAAGRWTGDSTQVGDHVFVFSGNKVYKLTVDSILTAGTIMNLRVRDSTATLASFPTGVCALMRLTANNMYPATIPGIPNVLGSKITTYFAEQADEASVDLTGYATETQVGDTSALLRGLISVAQDSGENKLGISTLAQNKFIFANGSKTGSTTLSYLNRALNRIFLDSLISFQVGRWTTGGRPISILNGLVGYNVSTNLFDVGVNGLWLQPALIRTSATQRIPYYNSSGQLTSDANFYRDSTNNRFFLGTNTGTAGLNVGGTATIAGATTITSGDVNLSNGRLNVQRTSAWISVGGASAGSAWYLQSNANSASQSYSNGTELVIFNTATSTSNAHAVVICGPRITSGNAINSSPNLDLRVNQIFSGTTYKWHGFSQQAVAGADTLNATYVFSRLIANGTRTELYRINQSGNFGIGNITPTRLLDVNGEVRFRDLSAGVISDGFIGVDVNGVCQKITVDGTTIGLNSNVLSIIGGTGAATKDVGQVAHGFTAPEAVFWNEINYKNADGVAGDTIRCSGIVTQVYSVDSFKLQFNGIHAGDFSLPEGMYYVNSTGGLSLTPDPDVTIPVMQVENGYSIINPIVEDEKQTLAGEIMTLETSTGSRSFDVGETLTMHFDSLVGKSYAALFAPTDTIVMTGANYYTIGDWNTAELATSDWTKRDTALVYTGTNNVVFKVSADVCYRIWPDNIATDDTYEVRLITGTGVSTMSRRYKEVPEDGFEDCVTMTAFYTGNNGGSNALIRVSIGNMPGEVKFMGGSLVVERL